MIKIVLTFGIAAWEKDNKRYTCVRKLNGEKKYYLYVVGGTHRFKIGNSVTSGSLADINKRLEKIEVEIVED